MAKEQVRRLSEKETESGITIAITRLSTFVIGINFVLGSYYNLVYFSVLGLKIKRMGLTLFDYMKIGLELLPIVIIITIYSLFSLRVTQETKKHKRFKQNKYLDFIGQYWILEILICILIILYRAEIMKSLAFAIFVLVSPFFIYTIFHKRFEASMKIRIPFMYRFLIKFTLSIVILFTAIGAIDAYMDKNDIGSDLYSIDLTEDSQFSGVDRHFEGFVLRSFDRVTIVKVEEKIVIVNNEEVLNLVKLEDIDD